MGEVDSESDIVEECRECRRETPHSVSVELRVESDKGENAAYSREPYRVSNCRVCGAESVIRLNNA